MREGWIYLGLEVFGIRPSMEALWLHCEDSFSQLPIELTVAHDVSMLWRMLIAF